MIRLLIASVTCALLSTMPAADEIRIGVLAKDGPARCMEMWGGTATFLQTKLPDHRFTIVPLAFDAVNPACEKGEVTFALINPGLGLTMRDRHGATIIATMITIRDGQPATGFGGVIFTRTDLQDLTSLAALKGKRFLAVKKTSFGGWLAGWKALADAGIDPAKDFASLGFADKHENVVLNVLNGKADAGTVRTDTLERMAKRGDIDLAEIRVLTPQQHPGFPFLCSTPLYPEWPLLAMKGTDQAVAAAVAAALQSMTKTEPAAIAASIAGWAPPSDYAKITELMKALNLSTIAE